jgi:hypothetical protein
VAAISAEKSLTPRFAVGPNAPAAPALRDAVGEEDEDVVCKADALDTTARAGAGSESDANDVDEPEAALPDDVISDGKEMSDADVRIGDAEMVEVSREKDGSLAAICKEDIAEKKIRSI